MGFGKTNSLGNPESLRHGAKVPFSRRGFIACVAGVSAAAALRAQGCSGSGSSEGSSVQSIKIGTMQTEDSLPFWIAEQEGFFASAGVEVSMVTFQSAQELSTAFAAGEIDAAMTDVQTASALEMASVAVELAWVTLGADPSQGRFGIMTSPESGYTSLQELAGVPIGVGSNTVPEYVMDKLMLAAGVAQEDIVGEEIKKLPVRFESMTSNQVAAAALPGSLLALGEAQGMVLLADDTTGENISQSVMAVRADWLSNGAAVLCGVQSAWDQAVDAVNSNPEAYRALLVEKANLPGLIADTYPVSTYPVAARPTAQMVQPVLDWMLAKGYLSAEILYDQETGRFEH